MGERRYMRADPRGAHIPAALAELALHAGCLLLVQHKHEHAVLARRVVLAQQLLQPPIARRRIYHLHYLPRHAKSSAQQISSPLELPWPHTPSKAALPCAFYYVLIADVHGGVRQM